MSYGAPQGKFAKQQKISKSKYDDRPAREPAKRCKCGAYMAADASACGWCGRELP